MKKYIYVILLFLGCIAGCTPDDNYSPAKYEYAGIRVAGVPNTIVEDSAVPLSIPVYYGGELSNPSPFTVSYTVTGGTYGTDYTIVGGTSPNGTVTIEQGEAGSTAMGVIMIQPVADFDTEADVNLTVTLTSASNGISVGHPLPKSFSFTIKDDDCEFAYIGELTGVDGNVNGLSFQGEAAVTISFDEGVYTISGLNVDFMENIWGETIQESVPVVFTVTEAGVITIEEQYIFTTLYDGDLYDYTIVGTGQVNSCDGNVTINYEMIQDGFEVGDWLHTNGPPYMSDPIFKAVLIPEE